MNSCKCTNTTEICIGSAITSNICVCSEQGENVYYGGGHGPHKDGHNLNPSIYQLYHFGNEYKVDRTVGKYGSYFSTGDFISNCVPSMIHIYLIGNYNNPLLELDPPKTIITTKRDGKIVQENIVLYDTYIRGPVKLPNLTYDTTRLAISRINKLPLVLDLRVKYKGDILIQCVN